MNLHLDVAMNQNQVFVALVKVKKMNTTGARNRIAYKITGYANAEREQAQSKRQHGKTCEKGLRRHHKSENLTKKGLRDHSKNEEFHWSA